MNSSVSLIDNIFTNNKNLALLITDISGHFPLFCTLSIKYNVKIKSKTYVLLCYNICYKFISFMFDTNLNNLLFI